MSLKFKCPSCQCNDLEVVEVDVVVSSQVVEIDKEGYVEYDILESDGGCIDRYRCRKCGLILKDEKGEPLATEDEMVEWIKNNCPHQDEEKG